MSINYVHKIIHNKITNGITYGLARKSVVSVVF